jgi:hypothetical protein
VSKPRRIVVDGGEIAAPSEFGALARRRQAQADARHAQRTAPLDRVEDDHYRATCPGCHATNVVMSPVAPHHSMATPPSKGDCIECDACGALHVVDQVNGYVVKTWGPLNHLGGL